MYFHYFKMLFKNVKNIFFIVYEFLLKLFDNWSHVVIDLNKKNHMYLSSVSLCVLSLFKEVLF